MQNENWKESLRNLAADELRNIRSFVDELIQESEAKATIPATAAAAEIAPVIVYPPDTPQKSGERRTEKRFDMKISGTCAILDRSLNDYSNEEIPITIKDVSQHGIRFIINRSLLPSNHLIIKFSLSPAGVSGNLYRKPQKKISVEVRRVLKRSTSSGEEYDIGALSIDEDSMEKLQEEVNGIEVIKKTL